MGLVELILLFNCGDDKINPTPCISVEVLWLYYCQLPSQSSALTPGACGQQDICRNKGFWLKAYLLGQFVGNADSHRTCLSQSRWFQKLLCRTINFVGHTGFSPVDAMPHPLCDTHQVHLPPPTTSNVHSHRGSPRAQQLVTNTFFHQSCIPKTINQLELGLTGNSNTARTI